MSISIPTNPDQLYKEIVELELVLRGLYSKSGEELGEDRKTLDDITHACEAKKSLLYSRLGLTRGFPQV